jgi:DNA-binding LacI/PurR family transcriptional regulator
MIHYLLAKGHRRIGMIVPEVDCQEKVERFIAYRRIMHEAGLEQRVQMITHGKNPDIDSGHEAALQLLGAHPDLTAIYCYNDLIAVGSIQACRELGRRVPDDCAVSGFDDIPFASIIEPALTTIHYDKFEIGRRAVLRLLEMIEQPECVFEPIQLEAKLIVRNSA